MYHATLTSGSTEVRRKQYERLQTFSDGRAVSQVSTSQTYCNGVRVWLCRILHGVRRVNDGVREPVLLRIREIDMHELNETFTTGLFQHNDNFETLESDMLVSHLVEIKRLIAYGKKEESASRIF